MEEKEILTEEIPFGITEEEQLENQVTNEEVDDNVSSESK